MQFWVSTYSHPKGASDTPDYLSTGVHVYPSGALDTADPRAAWFVIADQFAYPTDGHPEGASEQPWFEAIGSFIYATVHHPGGYSIAHPLYQVKECLQRR